MSQYRVIFSATARQHLTAIADFIGEDNPRRALTFIRELQRRCRDLSTHPMIGPVARRSAGRDVRRVVHGRYNIFYRVDTRIIEIMAVLPGAVDLDAIFPRDPHA
jgi:plasmid stabilization system protein ParE